MSSRRLHRKRTPNNEETEAPTLVTKSILNVVSELDLAPADLQDEVPRKEIEVRSKS